MHAEDDLRIGGRGKCTLLQDRLVLDLGQGLFISLPVLLRSGRQSL